MEPLISVIVPIYNINDEYLKQCLHSLQKQTYTNIEILAVIDGSPNVNNELICKKFQSKDSRFHCIIQSNKGVSAARNNGLMHATGQWITFVDPDDWVDCNYIKEMYENIQSGTDIVICDCYAIRDGKKRINHFFPADIDINVENIKEVAYSEIFGRNKIYNPPYVSIGVPWGKLYNTHFIRTNKLTFIPSLRRMQDNVYNMYAIFFSKKIVYVNKPFYYYRINNHSISAKYSKTIFNDFEKVFLETEAFISKFFPEDEKYKQYYYSRIIQSFSPYFKLYFSNPNNPNSYRENKKIFLNLLSKEPFREAVKNIQISRLPISMKILFLLIKSKQYCILNHIFSLSNKI